MLPKNYRLKNNSAFIATYKLKNTVADDFFIMYIGANKDDNSKDTRIGFVVSKKISKRAVKRNRIKRLAREVIRLKIKNSELNEAEKLKSLIFIARPKSLNADFLTVQNSINNLLSRIK